MLSCNVISCSIIVVNESIIESCKRQLKAKGPPKQFRCAGARFIKSTESTQLTSLPFNRERHGLRQYVARK